MKGTKVSSPKRKKRVFVNKESPLPVPIGNITSSCSNQGWCCYSGFLSGPHVIIKHTGDIDYLYRMGFFGKGTLSRSGPDYNKVSSMTAYPNHDEKVRIVPKRKYLNHVRWSRERDGSLLTDSGTLNLMWSPKKEPSENQEMKKGRNGEFLENESNENSLDSEMSNRITKTWESDTASEAADIFWGAENSVLSAYDANETTIDLSKEADGRAKTQTEWQPSGEKDQTADIWSTSIADQPSDRGVWSTSIADQPSDRGVWSASIADQPSDRGVWSTSIADQPSDRGVTEEQRDTRYQKVDAWEDDEKTTFWDNSSQETSDDFWNNDLEDNAFCELSRNEKDANASISAEAGRKESSRSVCPKTISVQSEVAIKREPQQPGGSEVIDPRSELDDPQSNIFVIEDSDDVSDDDEDDMGVVKKLKWRPCLKTEPYNVEEYLQLSLEEAFFLSYGLGCLVVNSHIEKLMNLTEMWETFCSLQQNFPMTYVAYHNFRCKGWVPKPGLKYGSDFMLYKEGPPFYHSSYSVVVYMVDETSLEGIPELNSRPISWPLLAALNRVTEQVSKELLLCYVIKPSAVTLEDMKSPKCIASFKIQEVLLKRWVSSQEREQEEIQ